MELLGGVRDWLVFSAVECVLLLVFLLMYSAFLVLGMLFVGTLLLLLC